MIQIILVDLLIHSEHPKSETLSYFYPSNSVHTEHKYDEYPLLQITGNSADSFLLLPPKQASLFKHSNTLSVTLFSHQKPSSI